MLVLISEFSLLQFYNKSWYMVRRGFPHSSVGKEPACNAGDPSSIPGLGRSPGEGRGYPLQHSWPSLVAQLIKNPPVMQVDLGLIPALGRSPGEGQGYKSRTWLSNFHFHLVRNFLVPFLFSAWSFLLEVYKKKISLLLKLKFVSFFPPHFTSFQSIMSALFFKSLLKA